MSGAGFRLTEPTDLLSVNKAILKELRSQNGLRGGEGGEATRGGQDEGILGEVSTLAALDNFRVLVGGLKEIYIADWPFELRSLEIRLNDPRNPAIQVLRHGRRIISRFPIKEIYITTTQTLSGNIVILDGSIRVSDVPWSLLNPLSFEQRRKHVRIENQADFDPPEEIGAIDQPGLFFLQDRLTVATTTIFFTGLQANSRLRCYGNASSEIIAAAGDLTEFQIQLATDPGSANRNIIHRHQFTTQESVTKWDVEYFFDTVETQIEVFVIDPGPVGNGIKINMHLEVHPL